MSLCTLPQQMHCISWKLQVHYARTNICSDCCRVYLWSLFPFKRRTDKGFVPLPPDRAGIATILCCPPLACLAASSVCTQGEENITETFRQGPMLTSIPHPPSENTVNMNLLINKLLFKLFFFFLTKTNTALSSKLDNSHRQPKMQPLLSALFRFFLIPLLGRIYCQLCALIPIRWWLPSGSGTASICTGFPRDLQRWLKKNQNKTFTLTSTAGIVQTSSTNKFTQRKVIWIKYLAETSPYPLVTSTNHIVRTKLSSHVTVFPLQSE